MYWKGSRGLPKKVNFRWDLVEFVEVEGNIFSSEMVNNFAQTSNLLKCFYVFWKIKNLLSMKKDDIFVPNQKHKQSFMAD